MNRYETVELLLFMKPGPSSARRRQLSGIKGVFAPVLFLFFISLLGNTYTFTAVTQVLPAFILSFDQRIKDLHTSVRSFGRLRAEPSFLLSVSKHPQLPYDHRNLSFIS